MRQAELLGPDGKCQGGDVSGGADKGVRNRLAFSVPDTFVFSVADALVKALMLGGGKAATAFNKRYKVEIDQDALRRMGNGSTPNSGVPLPPVKITRKNATNTTPSPALPNSPYNPEIVKRRIKPPYDPNLAHNKHISVFDSRKTPEPADAATVYDRAVRANMKTWYGLGKDGQIYRYFSDNVGHAHFSGIVSPANVPKSVRQALGLN